MKIHSIAAATLCTILLAACNNNPEEAVSHFYAATQANDFEKALTYTNIAEEEREGVIDVLSEMGMVIHSFKVTTQQPLSTCTLSPPMHSTPTACPTTLKCLASSPATVGKSK